MRPNQAAAVAAATDEPFDTCGCRSVWASARACVSSEHVGAAHVWGSARACVCVVCTCGCCSCGCGTDDLHAPVDAVSARVRAARAGVGGSAIRSRRGGKTRLLAGDFRAL